MNSKAVKGVSVVICSYNGAQRLPPTLEHLSRQKVDSAIPWEIVLVDNASDDNMAALAKKQWDTTGNSVPIRMVSHPIPGKTGALQLGIEKALYDYLVICDDDNWLASNYVQLVYEIMNQHLGIGALGGKSSPAFETMPPKWFERAGSAYATGLQHEETGPLYNNWEVLWGAGMVLNREALNKLNSSGFKYLLTTKRGKTIVSGEDDEVCYALKLIDYKVWYDSRLELQHFIPAYRLTENYLKRLMYGSATAILACEPYQRILAYKQNPNICPKCFNTFASLISLLKFVARENVKFFPRYFHSDPWTRVNYRSGLLIKWLRIKKTSLMNSNLLTIKHWFDNITTPK